MKCRYPQNIKWGYTLTGSQDICLDEDYYKEFKAEIFKYTTQEERVYIRIKWPKF